MRLVVTIGTFDLFHAGHANLIGQCRRLAGRDGKVIVGVNTDEFVRKFKREYPVMDTAERQTIVAAMRDVDITLPHDGTTLAWLREWRVYANNVGQAKKGELVIPDILLVVGSDWAKKDYLAQLGVTKAELNGLGVMIVYVPYSTGISTTQIKERICSAEPSGS